MQGNTIKIATWNVERLKHYKDMYKMLENIRRQDADILVLTETDERIKPDYPYYYHTPLLTGEQQFYYAETENRVSVFSKYECVKQYDTYDEDTAICVELKTPSGSLLVYGTIIGISGNRRPDFIPDLKSQMDDVRRLTADGHNICILGDYNLSFADNWYYTKEGRRLINETFDECGISLLTRDRTECIDHIAISEKFIGNVKSIDEWNLDKSLSDHKGIIADIVA